MVNPGVLSGVHRFAGSYYDPPDNRVSLLTIRGPQIPARIHQLERTPEAAAKMKTILSAPTGRSSLDLSSKR